MAKLFSEGGGGSAIMDGVFLKDVKIVDVMTREEFNKSKGWDAPQYPKTIDFVVKYQDGDYTKELLINGNVFSNGSLPQHISSFLVAIGILENENKEGMIESLANGLLPNSLVEMAKGKTIKVVEYVKTSGYYEAWNGIQDGFNSLINVFDISTESEDIKNAFKKKLDSKYPPKYDVAGLGVAKKQKTDDGESDEVESPI